MSKIPSSSETLGLQIQKSGQKPISARLLTIPSGELRRAETGVAALPSSFPRFWVKAEA